jgi:hypothetical protein
MSKKPETKKEAAAKNYPIHPEFVMTGINYDKYKNQQISLRLAFVLGAEWQQRKSRRKTSKPPHQ